MFSLRTDGPYIVDGRSNNSLEMKAKRSPRGEGRQSHKTTRVKIGISVMQRSLPCQNAKGLVVDPCKLH